MSSPANSTLLTLSPAGPKDFRAALAEQGHLGLQRGAVTTLQVNITKRCNLACHHCHVESGPKRTEAMDRRTAERVLELLERNPGVGTLDLTGGAPELNPHFRFLVAGARTLGRAVIDRCNLTVLFEPGQEDVAEFLAAQRVHVVASLPCYSKKNVEKQRGRHVFDKSIAALRQLNALGYGQPQSPLRLDLAYNPLGPFLPPSQAELQASYRRELHELFGVSFNELLTLTNMPIRRFAHDLMRQGKLDAYCELLASSFNPATVDGLMCRSTLSVDHDGKLYDCDFNQALDLPLGDRARTIWEIEDLAKLGGMDIATDHHCFGCTAGTGSSCGGALA